LRLPLALVSLLLCSAARAGAQSDTITAPSPWAVGGTLMVPAAYPLATAIGIQGASTSTGRLGFDGALAVVPLGLFVGAFAVGGRANVSLPVRLGPGAIFVPSVGLSFFGSTGTSGSSTSGGSRGLNASAAVVLFAEAAQGQRPPAGVRFGVAWHRFGRGEGADLPVLELGIVRIQR
jgi:hypothetical protein